MRTVLESHSDFTKIKKFITENNQLKLLTPLTFFLNFDPRAEKDVWHDVVNNKYGIMCWVNAAGQTGKKRMFFTIG